MIKVFSLVVRCPALQNLHPNITYSGTVTTHLYNTTITLECGTGMYVTDSYTQTTDVLCDVNTDDVTTGEWSPDVENISCIGTCTCFHVSTYVIYPYSYSNGSIFGILSIP